MASNNLNNISVPYDKLILKDVPGASIMGAEITWGTRDCLGESLNVDLQKRWERIVEYCLELFSGPLLSEEWLLDDRTLFNEYDLHTLTAGKVLLDGESESVKDLSIKKILDNVEKAEDKLWYPLIYLAIAVLLANCKTRKFPYEWLNSDENSGVWIRALLGKEHYNQFLQDKQKVKDKFESESNASMKKSLGITLERSEMEYFINNVRWSNKSSYFWFHKWLDNDSSVQLLSKGLIQQAENYCLWLYNK